MKPNVIKIGNFTLLAHTNSLIHGGCITNVRSSSFLCLVSVRSPFIRRACLRKSFPKALISPGYPPRTKPWRGVTLESFFPPTPSMTSTRRRCPRPSSASGTVGKASARARSSSRAEYPMVGNATDAGHAFGGINSFSLPVARSFTAGCTEKARRDHNKSTGRICWGSL